MKRIINKMINKIWFVVLYDYNNKVNEKGVTLFSIVKVYEHKFSIIALALVWFINMAFTLITLNIITNDLYSLNKINTYLLTYMLVEIFISYIYMNVNKRIEADNYEGNMTLDIIVYVLLKMSLLLTKGIISFFILDIILGIVISSLFKIYRNGKNVIF